MTVAAPTQNERRHWLAVLARADAAELERAVAALDAPRGDIVRASECGLVMLRGRIGGTGDAFNLGEATVTRSAVRIGDRLGIGYTLGRDTRKAELIAVLDALLQEPGRREDLMGSIVAPMARDQARQREQASRAAAASRVEFFTMVRGATA
jgi:alpha-D-ribose 1-methylphosphonate 5-triphosphate synthase subunit PhnG